MTAKLTEAAGPKELMNEELEVTRLLLKEVLARGSLERTADARQIRSWKRKHAAEKKKREQAYVTVARLQSDLGLARLKIKSLTT